MNKEEFLAIFTEKPTLCDTEEKSRVFLKLCDTFNINWASGANPLKYNNYNFYKEKTCYNIQGNKLYYGNTDYYIREKIDIYLFITKESFL